MTGSVAGTPSRVVWGQTAQLGKMYTQALTGEVGVAIR